jgi:hypothetical protein
MYDISVYVGENIRENTKAAFRKAIKLIDSGHFKKALIVNTTTRQRWALAAAREIDPNRIGDDHRMPVICEGVSIGDLCKQLYHVRELIRSQEIDVLIINSWEFASANPRFKDALLFGLRGLMDEFNVTVILYSHQVDAGRRDMGKITRELGKLSAVAGLISTVEQDEEREMQEEEMTASAQPEEISERFVSEKGILAHVSAEVEDEYPEPYEEVYEGDLVSV